MDTIFSILFYCKNVLLHLHDAIVGNSSQMLVTAVVIIVLTGLIGGLMAKKLKQPLILGYILAGVFVGIAYKASFGESANGAIDSMANIGVALLLFSMGLEFSKDDIRPIYKIAVWGSLAQVLFTLIAGAGIAYILSKTIGLFTTGTSMLLFGVAFVSTSTAVILKTLTSNGQMGTLSSKVMIGMSIVQDLTVIPLMLIVSKLSNFSEGVMSAVEPLILGAVFMFVIMTAGARYLPKLLEFVLTFNSRELFLLAVICLSLGIGFISEAMQVSFSFGAFLAGIALSDSSYGKKALSEMIPVRDFFAMLFFVSIGMMLDFQYLSANFLLVMLLVVLTSMSRTVFLSAVTWFSGYRNVIPVAMFFGMVATSEIAFIVIQVVQTEGLISADVYSLILCVVVCSMILGPAVDNLTSPVYRMLSKTILKKCHVSDVVLPLPDLHNHVIIAGGDATARSIAKLMTSLRQQYIIIESDHRAFQAARSEKLVCMFGDPQHEIILSAAGIERAKLVLAASSAFVDNLATVKCARELRPDIPVVTCAESKDEVDILFANQIFEVVQPEFESALEMTRLALLRLQVPAVAIQNYMDTVRFEHYRPFFESRIEYGTVSRMRSLAGMLELYWMELDDSCFAVNKTIAQSNIRVVSGVSIVGVIRDGNMIMNPAPELKLLSGDLVAGIGTREQKIAFEHVMRSGKDDTTIPLPPVGTPIPV